MEDVVWIGLPLGECVGLQHRQSWLRFPPNTDEEVHSCWANDGMGKLRNAEIMTNLLSAFDWELELQLVGNDSLGCVMVPG